MTVQFKYVTSELETLPGDVLFEAFKNNEAKKVILKQLKQVDSIYLIRVYKTFSEKQPVKWEPYDIQTCTNTTAGDLTVYINEWIHHCKNQAEWHGYKILTMGIDALNADFDVLPNYSVEFFKPKEKVYINGPKKKPFPTKAAKHYV